LAAVVEIGFHWVLSKNSISSKREISKKRKESPRSIPSEQIILPNCKGTGVRAACSDILTVLAHVPLKTLLVGARFDVETK
jgi:hypothetical protein